jgi:hypothetical protein
VDDRVGHGLGHGERQVDQEGVGAAALAGELAYAVADRADGGGLGGQLPFGV